MQAPGFYIFTESERKEWMVITPTMIYEADGAWCIEDGEEVPPLRPATTAEIAAITWDLQNQVAREALRYANYLANYEPSDDEDRLRNFESCLAFLNFTETRP